MTEERRLKWNKYQLKRYHQSERYIVILIRRMAQEKHRKRMLEIKKADIRRRKAERHQKAIENKRKREKHYRESGLKAMWDKNPKRLAKKREYNQRPDIKIKRREYRRAWRKKHPEKRRSGNGGIKKEAFDKMRKEYNYTCPMCGRKEPFLDQYWPYLVQDHIIPRSKGGKKRSIDNIQPLCWDCNNKKGDKIINPIINPKTLQNA